MPPPDRLTAIVDRDVVGHFALEHGTLLLILRENDYQDMVTMPT
jgi:hypothetical protein